MHRLSTKPQQKPASGQVANGEAEGCDGRGRISTRSFDVTKSRTLMPSNLAQLSPGDIVLSRLEARIDELTGIVTE
jgi:hypothetical protein